MNKFTKRLAVLAGAMVVSFSAVAAFQSGMLLGQLEAEISAQKVQGHDLSQIASEALGVRIPVGLLAAALINQGFQGADVVAALEKAGVDQATATAAVANAVAASNPSAGGIGGGVGNGTINFSTPASTLGGGGGGGASRS